MSKQRTAALSQREESPPFLGVLLPLNTERHCLGAKRARLSLACCCRLSTRVRNRWAVVTLAQIEFYAFRDTAAVRVGGTKEMRL